MDIENRTIGELFRNTDARVNHLPDLGEDDSFLFRCAQFTFSHQIFLRYPSVRDLDDLDDRVIEAIARMSVAVIPTFVRVTQAWTERARTTERKENRREVRAS